MSKVSRFASLLGLGAKKAEDEKDQVDAKGEKPTQNEGESDDDFKERLKKWEDEQDDETAENPKDTSDDDQDKNDKAKKALKDAADAARAEGVTIGAKAEKARWADTLASAAAAGKPISAISMLADTDMNGASVQKALAALPAETGRTTLAQRTGGQPTPAPAPGGGEDPTKAEGSKGFGARMTATLDKVRPSKAAAR